VTSLPPDQSLVVALQTTIAALETGDIDGAAAAVGAMAQACEDAARAGTVFSPAQLAEARRLHSRCEALALQTQATVVAAVLQTSTQRRATDAYGSGK
jgi:hypothetical protein